MADPVQSVIVAKRGDTSHEPQLAVTDLGSPDLLLTPMNMAAMVAVRCGRVYFQVFVGLLTASGFGAVTLAGPGAATPSGAVAVVQAAALAACFPVVITFGQNVLELLTRIDERFPKFRA